MGAPRLEPSQERRRERVLDAIDWERVRDAPCLERIAEAVSSVVEVPSAHVSLMKTDTQCVVSAVGMDRDEFERDRSFCAHTIAERETLIVEDATEDARFKNNPLVQQEGGIRFYIGLPIVVDDAPAGTLCAIDYEPRSLHLAARAELFGLLHTTEAYLNMLFEHDPGGETYALASHMAEARASMTMTRHDEELDRDSKQRLVQAERRLETCLNEWVPESGVSREADSELEDVDAPTEGIGYEDTEPAED